MGTLLDILQVPGLPDRYVVEFSGADGLPVWLGDFAADELEPMDKQDAEPFSRPPSRMKTED